MTKENLLVTLADKNYIKQAKQLFSSVYWNAGWKGDYMLLAHEIPEKELRWFRKKGILVKKCKPLSKKGWGSWPPTLLDKFYLFTPEFKKWKNIIYLDADIIVRASLDELTKVKGFWASDIIPIKALYKRINYFMRQLVKSKGISIHKRTFNAGVFVLDTSLIKNNLFQLMINFFNKFRPFLLGHEETILNIFLGDKRKRLPKVYNVHINQTFYFGRSQRIKCSGIILHFAQRTDAECPILWHPKNPFYKEWKNNLGRAELIDLNNIPEGKKWSRFEIYKYSLVLSIRYFFKYIIEKSATFFCKFFFKLKYFLFYIINTPDRLLGKFGIFLKKHNAGLYHKLKRIEKKIRRWI